MEEDIDKVLNDHIWNQHEPQPIAVPLLGQHAQSASNANYHHDYEFIGRESLVSDLLATLQQTRNSRGCYLISGFRGSGKTTLINKVLNYYKRGAVMPAWLPDPGKTNNSAEFRAMLNRGYTKLTKVKRGKNAPPLRITNVFDKLCAWFAKIIDVIKEEYRKYRHRVITIKINLGQDELLSTREVLFNVATLLNHEFKSHFRFSGVIFSALSSLVVINIPGAINKYNSATEFFIYHLYINDILCIYPLYSTKYISFLFVIFLTSLISYFSWTRLLPTNARILNLLYKLNKRMRYTIELNKSVQSRGLSFGRTESMPPLDARQIENELISILNHGRSFNLSFVKPDVIFIFDELDKISASSRNVKESDNTSVKHDLRERKKAVDQLLGTLKNFITHGKARFFFIAGREMLDGYQAERGSTSSLYESLFNRVFEVPSLMTDTSDHNRQRIHSLIEVYLCRKLLDPDVAIYLWLHYKRRNNANDGNWESDLSRKLAYSPFCLRTYYHYLHFVKGMEGIEARRIVLGMRNFVQFLTLHSWGNPKRMQSLFIHFTKPVSDVDWRQKFNVDRIKEGRKDIEVALQFGLIDQQRIVMASNLYSQLYHNLGRQLASSGDKLAVSTMAAFQYILKFHRYPFSRYHLDNMSETLNIYRSPELNTMIDTMLSKVFSVHIRRIRNSHYRYRFSGYFEQEMRYISRVSDIESAAYNFSLDASSPTKAHYIEQLNDLLKKPTVNINSGVTPHDVTIYELCMIIGDLFALEQSHDEALKYYQMAVDVFDTNEDRQKRFSHLQVEAFLRLGEVFERRQSYDQAASVYLRARGIVKNLKWNADDDWYMAMEKSDSKWDVLRQPFWAYWFLHLKRSPVPWREDLPPDFEYPFSDYGAKIDDATNHYRSGQLAFFYGCYDTAINSFVRSINCSGIKLAWSKEREKTNTEKTTYLGSYGCLHLAENLFSGLMRYSWNNIKDNVNSCQSAHDLSKYASEFLNNIGFAINVTRGTSANNSSDRASEFLKKIRLENDSPFRINDIISLFTDSNGTYFNTLESFPIDNDRTITKNKREDNLLSRTEVFHTFGMMAYAAQQLEQSGMHHHASVAYIKILSIWSMMSEISIALCNITDRNEEPSSLKILFNNSTDFINDIRENAASSITKLTTGGHSRFQARWKSRDVVCFFNTMHNSEIGISRALSNRLDSEWEILSEHENSGFKLAESNTIGFDLNRTLKYLFPKDKKGIYSLRKKTEKEAIFMQRSMMGQGLIYLSVWEYMNNTGLRHSYRKRILKIPHHPMVPHSTRSLMFAHWLTGRRIIQWEVISKLSNYQSDNDSIYNPAAAAIHNCCRAIYYSKQLVGNDQDIMFPDSSMVFYDLWKLLYALVKMEKDSGKSFDDSALYVKHMLSASRFRRENTPANYYDFNNVTLRTISALQTIEQFGDISSRARTDAIRTHHYLADDYEDPRFHLDWTMIQMYGPLAGLLCRHVELSSNELKTSDVR